MQFSEDIPLQDLLYIDVDHVSELPEARPGTRYLDFMGGEKALRCYVLPEDYARCRFLERYASDMDEIFEPVYENRGVVVRQDTSYALPGFYIVSCSEHFRSFDEVPAVLSMRVAMVVREVRRLMRDLLGIEHIHLHSEEKPNRSTNVHFWLLPVQEFFTTVVVTNDVRERLASLRLSEQRPTILKYNELLRAAFVEANLTSIDDRIDRALSDAIGGMP